MLQPFQVTGQGWEHMASLLIFWGAFQSHCFCVSTQYKMLQYLEFKASNADDVRMDVPLQEYIRGEKSLGFTTDFHEKYESFSFSSFFSDMSDWIVAPPWCGVVHIQTTWADLYVLGWQNADSVTRCVPAKGATP